MSYNGSSALRKKKNEPFHKDFESTLNTIAKMYLKFAKYERIMTNSFQMRSTYIDKLGKQYKFLEICVVPRSVTVKYKFDEYK